MEMKLDNITFLHNFNFKIHYIIKITLLPISGAGTECAIGEEQYVIRQGRGCLDQVFAVRQVCEKYLANGKYVFWEFMDLEKTNDTSIGTACGRC